MDQSEAAGIADSEANEEDSEANEEEDSEANEEEGMDTCPH